MIRERILFRLFFSLLLLLSFFPFCTYEPTSQIHPKIVGYAFSDRIDTRLTLAALDMAYRRRKPARGLIFHSDRGVQYAARGYRERLEAYGIRQSMSRRGDPYDNAVAENFFSCLKCELVHLKHYPTRAAAQDDVFAYLEAFYNTIRPHSALGWRSPASFEVELVASAA